MPWRAGTILLLALAPLAVGAQHYTRPALRTELLQRLDRDQAIRDTFVRQLRQTGTLTPALVTAMRHVDSINLEWLEPQLRAHGLPTPAEVGKDGVEAATLLLQHADADPAFQAEMLPAMMAAYGRKDITGEAAALFVDRVAKAQHRSQVYGTQTTIQDGKVIVDPIDDSMHVDARRATMGLPPLALYRHVLDSIYAKRP